MAAVEERSAAEVVILVRGRSGPYLHACLVSGIVAGYVTLWFQLFSPWEFSLLAIQVAPAVVGAAVGLMTTLFPGLQRRLTPASMREGYVHAAARAAFHDNGIGDTRGRTGILVYISRLEREAAVLADRGVCDAVDGESWDRATLAIRSAARNRNPDAAAVAAAIAGLGDLLQTVLPRDADDVNELPDVVA